MKMKFRLIWVMVFIFAFLTTSISNAAIKPGKNSFKYFKEVVSPSPGFVKTAIDSDIYSNTEATLSDIRIFDTSGNEVPYYIYSSSASSNNKISAQTADIINKSSSGKALYFTIDRKNSKEITNKLEVLINNSSNNDYVYEAELEGSQDTSTWLNIKTEGYLYDLVGKVSSTKKVITFDANNYRYLKVKLIPVLGTLNSNDISSINLYYVQENKVKDTKLDTLITKTEQKEKSTFIFIDNKFKNAAFDKVKFITNDANFNRKVNISGSHDGQKWEQLENGFEKEIFVYKINNVDVNNNFVELQKSRFRYLRIEILNKDNPPVNLSSVEVYNSPDYLVFEHKAGQSYSVFFSNSTITKPEYDIQNLVSLIETSTLTDATTGKLIKNIQFTGEQKPLSERYAWLIWVIILSMVGALGYLIIKSIKNLKNSN